MRATELKDQTQLSQVAKSPLSGDNEPLRLTAQERKMKETGEGADLPVEPETWLEIITTLKK